MAARKFTELSAPIKADPVRAERIGRHRAEALGGRLEVAAVFEDERFPVTVGGDDIS